MTDELRQATINKLIEALDTCVEEDTESEQLARDSIYSDIAYLLRKLAGKVDQL